MLEEEKPSIKSYIKTIYRKTDARIVDIISGRKLHNEKRTKRRHPKIDGIDSSSSFDTMLSAARTYDINEFYILKVRNQQKSNRISTQRRLLLRIYTGTRKLIVGCLKHLYFKMRHK